MCTQPGVDVGTSRVLLLAAQADSTKGSAQDAVCELTMAQVLNEDKWDPWLDCARRAEMHGKGVSCEVGERSVR